MKRAKLKTVKKKKVKASEKTARKIQLYRNDGGERLSDEAAEEMAWAPAYDRPYSDEEG